MEEIQKGENGKKKRSEGRKERTTPPLSLLSISERESSRKRENAMEERRRGCFVATEAPSPLLGLVAIAVLPPSGCCAAAEELEGMSRCRRALSPSRCVAAHLFFTVAAHHHRRILCHQFESGYGFDSDDKLQRLIKIEKVCINFQLVL
ncbi:uncharacterized protein LOC107611535 [Arachis ipaensis]|uniref:uncharacterized protein LOC107611535 n=1 Tax=Arachis ipaensis TaxID=130454 RepID=UPI000A2B3FB1|nr:uncharacterized protein LOC107611535 [Arachis ipaensis]